MNVRRLLLAGAFLPAIANAQSADDSVAVIRGVATAVAERPGGPLLVGGDEGGLATTFANTLKTRRARTGELPNCGGLVGRLGVAPLSQASGYVVVLRAPEFAGDEATVGVAFQCLNTMGGRRGTSARKEVLVFRREANGWSLARRSKS